MHSWLEERIDAAVLFCNAGYHSNNTNEEKKRECFSYRQSVGFSESGSLVWKHGFLRGIDCCCCGCWEDNQATNYHTWKYTSANPAELPHCLCCYLNFCPDCLSSLTSPLCPRYYWRHLNRKDGHSLLQHARKFLSRVANFTKKAGEVHLIISFI